MQEKFQQQLSCKSSPMPKSRLVSITSMLVTIRERSQDRLNMDELTEALGGIMKGNFMIYDGSTNSLAEPIVADLLDESSGWNKRIDLVNELFSSRYWLGGGGVFHGFDGNRIEPQDLMVLDEDATKISDALWDLFYADNQSANTTIQTQEVDKSINSQTSALTSRDHVSNKLAVLRQASDKFWANADRTDRATHPDSRDVISWLIGRGYSETLADKAATIIRPEWAGTGRKPDK